MEEERKEDTGIYETDDVDIRKYFSVVLNKWKFIAAFTGSFTVLTLFVSFLLTPIYRSTAVILPINESISPILEGSGLSSLIALIGMGGGSSSSKIMAILESNAIKERIINRHDLMKIILDDDWDSRKGKWKDDPPSIWEGLRAMEDMVSIRENRKTGAISIITDFKDPTMAANISQWFIEELGEILQEKSFTMARHERENIEEIINSLKGHLKVPESDLPDFTAFMRKMRDLEISERAYEEILVKYYIARFQEAKEDVVFQVIDEAKPPDKPKRPIIWLNVCIAFTISMLLSCYIVVLRRKRKEG